MIVYYFWSFVTFGANSTMNFPNNSYITIVHQVLNFLPIVDSVDNIYYMSLLAEFKLIY